MDNKARAPLLSLARECQSPEQSPWETAAVVCSREAVITAALKISQTES